jgi:competence protein ComEC
MIRWIPFTFVRTVFFLILGILTGIYAPDLIPVEYCVIVLAALLLIYFIIFLVKQIFNKSFLNAGYVALPIIFICGFLNLIYHAEIRNVNHFLRSISSTTAYKVTLTKYAEEKDRSWKIEGEVISVRTDQWRNAEGKVLLYFSKTDFLKPPEYGDVLLLKGAPKPVPSPANPGEFDYKKFLSFRNIYHQQFLKRNDVMVLGNEPQSYIIEHAIKTRLWAKGALYQYVEGTQEQAIASALVLGVTDGLDDELLSAYAATGSMHVLAVSGLHISIIYLILVFLFKPITKSRAGKWVLAITSLLVLWAYAFITGLSPSVLRAVVMFSFIAVAKATGRNTNIYNTLAASGFCILMYDPYLIMSVGFQLSYLAVLGIVYLEPKLYLLWEAPSWAMEQIWKITCVSIAAQLATLSLGLLYFHQFPNYFLLSNLLVIPVSFLVLIFGLGLLSVSFISIIAKVVGICLAWTIKIMNWIVLGVEWLPYSLIEDIHITTLQCWLLMGIILCMMLMIEYKKFSYVYIGAMLVLAFTIIEWNHFYEVTTKPRITVYRVPGHVAIDFMKDARAYFITDTSLTKDDNKIRFHIRPNRVNVGITQLTELSNAGFSRSVKGGELISWNGKMVLYINSKDFETPVAVNHFDLIIIGNNSVETLLSLQAWYPDTPVVLDSSNSTYYSTRLVKEAKDLNLNIHSVHHQGAYEFHLDEQT